MATQNCPRCASNRIRRGYRPTPVWSKILFRYNLLCDSCNWEFRGFAIPGTVSTKSAKKRKKANGDESADENNLESDDSESAAAEKRKNKQNNNSPNQKNEKRVRIKL